MSESNFLNAEEAFLLSACLFKERAFSSMREGPQWLSFRDFSRQFLNSDPNAVGFGVKYFQKIIRRRRDQKNLIIANLVIGTLERLFEIQNSQGRFRVFREVWDICEEY